MPMQGMPLQAMADMMPTNMMPPAQQPMRERRDVNERPLDVNRTIMDITGGAPLGNTVFVANVSCWVYFADFCFVCMYYRDDC